MSNIPRWNDVRADFGDTGRMFSAAQQGLSNAGTVFGQLRASILAEEQRAVDNAFREKQLNENIRQFEVGANLNERRFGLETDKFEHEQEQDTIKNAQWDKTHGLDRTKELNRMAERVSDDTGNVVRYNGATGNYSPLVNSTSSNTGVPAFILNGIVTGKQIGRAHV